MPNRPRSHQLSDESRRAFEDALPDAWVFRPEQPDYGIDGDVEIFEEAGNSTGYRFFVQLKATDDPDPRGAESVTLRQKTAAYYHSLDLPVLIVSYHSPTKSIYARWFQEFNPNYTQNRRGTTVVRFTDEHRWTDATSRQILSDLEKRRLLRTGSVALPLLVNVRAEASSSIASTFKKELAAALVSLRDTVNLTEQIDRALATIAVFDDRVIAKLGSECSATFHIDTKTADVRALASDAVLLLSIALGRARQYQIAARIAIAVADSSTIIERYEVFVQLARDLARGRRVADALELSEKLARRFGPTWATEAFRIPALTARDLSEGERTLYETYLARRVELAKAAADLVQLSIAHYNRAKFFRATGRQREAIRELGDAARADPTYWDRDYFCSEFAGMLFILRRYRCATHLYRRSLDRGASSETRALLADALLFSGRYAQAKEQFAIYLAASEKIAAEWKLKDWALTEILKLNITSQVRSTITATAVAGEVKDGVVDPARLDEAVRLDALCGLAWFNKGGNALAGGDRRAGVVYYLLAALCQSWDLEAWRNAYALATEHEEDRVLVPWILIAGYELYGESFLEAIAAAITSPAEAATCYMESLRRFLNELPGREGTLALRLLGPGSEYIVLDINAGTVRRAGHHDSA